MLGYATGVRSRDLACPLYGRREASLREGVLLGLRSNDIKYIQDPASMTEELYDLVMDPSEASNLAGDPRQSVPLGLCRGQVAPNREALGFTGSSQPAEVLSPEVDRATLDRLEVLGYTE